MISRRDRIIAAAIAALINLLFLAVLLRDRAAHVATPVQPAPEAEHALQVVWIERRREVVPEPHPSGTPGATGAPGSVASSPRPRTNARASIEPSPPVVAHAPPEPDMETAALPSGRNAPWNGVAGPAHSDDGIDAATFRKPLLASAPQSLEAPRVASFVLRDSSLLGRLRDMEQRMTCAELRAALRVASNDGALIVETMKQRGCPI